ncbi:hypothetical protein [uncultured Eudoraea sp.]|uniref:hypothetical protein n=1 Tax=uncultured Eudoraea sp. TaxID=1035614 RepID=UPI00261C82DD|nr:hypothetical protein [uncultured Eudoraea sp.]
MEILLAIALTNDLKAKKIDAYFKSLKALIIFRQNKEVYGETNLNYEKITITNPNSYGKLKEIPHKHERPFPLKLVVNDFLYANIEHKDQMIFQEVLQEQGSFIISGKNITQKITYVK